MVDDSMEISSDHGHNQGDVDIDIDFDFTGGQLDEDDQLPDAMNNEDFDFQLQPHAELGNDELMIDEDDGSYQMVDTDLQLVDEMHDPEQMSFATPDASAFGHSDLYTANAMVDDIEQQPRVIYERHERHEATTNEVVDANLQQETPGEELQYDETTIPGDSLEELSAKDEDLKEAAPVSACSLPQKEATPQSKIQEPGSPLASLSRSASPGHTINSPKPNTTPSSVHDDAADADSNGSTKDYSRALDVRVVYLSDEYALFSASESDHPDTFFLSDLSVAEKPLSELFRALRVIIRDELAEEDELCITVEDLGLETEEDCFSIQNVTLAHILDLHEMLYHNDGLDVRPLYIHLKTRTNFYKRFSSMTAGATEGKGLSHFSTWDEQSDSLIDITQTEGSRGEPETNEEHPPQGDTEAVDNFHKEGSERDVQEHAEELTAEQESLNDGPLPSSENAKPIIMDAASFNAKPQDNIDQTEMVVPQNEQNIEEGQEDEGVNDLIDYSEDEEEQFEAQDTANVQTSDVTGNVGQFAETAKDTHTRSQSRAASHLSEQSREQDQLLTNEGGANNTEGDANSYGKDNTEFDAEDYSNDEAGGEEVYTPTNHGNPNRTAQDQTGHEEYNGEDFVHDTTDEGYADLTASHNIEHGADEGYADLTASHNVEHGAEEHNGELLSNNDIDGNDELPYDERGHSLIFDEESYNTGITFGIGNAYEDQKEDEEHQDILLSAQPRDFDASDNTDFALDEQLNTSNVAPALNGLGLGTTTASSATLSIEDIQHEELPDEETIVEDISTDRFADINNAIVPDACNTEDKDEIDYSDDEIETEEKKELDSTVPKYASALPKETPNTNGKRSIDDVESSNALDMTKDVKRSRS